MNTKFFGGVLSVIFLSMTAFAQQAKPTIDSLGWMSGCWELKRGGLTINEQWMKPAGQTLIGMSRTSKGEKTIMFEFLRIAEVEGSIYYIALPSGEKETKFKLAKAGNNEAVFENTAHDFPQRIIYRSGKKDELFARIESADKKEGMDIPMTRTKCEP